MNGTRNAAMWLGIIGVATGVIAIGAVMAGDIWLALGWDTAVAAVALVVLAIGAFLSLYRPLTAAGLMLVAVLAVLVGEWSAISQYAVDLWTTGTGGYVSFVDSQGVGHAPDFWGVLFGSAGLLGYAGTLILGTVGAIVSAVAPEPTAVEVRRTAPAAI